MFAYSKASMINLHQCDPNIVKVFDEVIKYIDCTIFTGYRNEETQNEMYRTGKSQLTWPTGKHNSLPSKAIDVIPCSPINWKDRERMTLFAGFVLGIAANMGITLRWGGDWDCDFKVKDNSFDDLCHFELMED